jgi:hypothetical protein
VKKQRTVIPSAPADRGSELQLTPSLEVSEPVVSKPTPTRPEIPEEQLPILTGANRILWGRMGGAVIGCTLIGVAAVLFESCL